MQARRLYQSRVLVLAITLLVLGVGNTIIGTQKLGQYQVIVAEGAPADTFRMPPARPIASSRPLDDEGERYNIGRAKVDLYHVVLSGGLVMMAVGLVLTLIGWLRLRLEDRTPPGTRARAA